MGMLPNFKHWPLSLYSQISRSQNSFLLLSDKPTTAANVWAAHHHVRMLRETRPSYRKNTASLLRLRPLPAGIPAAVLCEAGPGHGHEGIGNRDDAEKMVDGSGAGSLPAHPSVLFQAPVHWWG